MPQEIRHRQLAVALLVWAACGNAEVKPWGTPPPVVPDAAPAPPPVDAAPFNPWAGLPDGSIADVAAPLDLDDFGDAVALAVA